MVTGPRQSGKTTLVKKLFQDYTYYNLEFPDVRLYAQTDPRDFLTSAERMIIDEAQNLPEIFSYIQALVDEEPRNGRFIITGSSNLTLLQQTGQSLAGRVAIFELFPFSIAELKKHSLIQTEANEQLLQGFYPRIFSEQLTRIIHAKAKCIV